MICILNDFETISVCLSVNTVEREKKANTVLWKITFFGECKQHTWDDLFFRKLLFIQFARSSECRFKIYTERDLTFCTQFLLLSFFFSYTPFSTQKIPFCSLCEKIKIQDFRRRLWLPVGWNWLLSNNHFLSKFSLKKKSFLWGGQDKSKSHIWKELVCNIS